MAYFDGSDDIFDSREVIERIAELTAEWEEGANLGEEEGRVTASDYELSGDDWALHLGEEQAAELVALLALKEEAANDIANFDDGETFISDDYFDVYARELANDIGAIDSDAGWPANYIDWEAASDALKMDYTPFEFRGTTYWAR